MALYDISQPISVQLFIACKILNHHNALRLQHWKVDPSPLLSISLHWFICMFWPSGQMYYKSIVFDLIFMKTIVDKGSKRTLLDSATFQLQKTVFSTVIAFVYAFSHVMKNINSIEMIYSLTAWVTVFHRSAYRLSWPFEINGCKFVNSIKVFFLNYVWLKIFLKSLLFVLPCRIKPSGCGILGKSKPFNPRTHERTNCQRLCR